MKLSNERITLCPLGESDLEFFLEMQTCPDITQHVSTPANLDEAKAAFAARLQPWDIKSDQWLTLPITEIQCDEKVGWVSLRVVNHQAKIAEIGFILKSKAQGRGVASSAAKLLKDYAFNTLKLNKLVAFCSVHNTASYQLLEKQGFVREGCLMQNVLINDQYVDTYAYGLCRSNL